MLKLAGTKTFLDGERNEISEGNKSGASSFVSF